MFSQQRARPQQPPAQAPTEPAPLPARRRAPSSARSEPPAAARSRRGPWGEGLLSGARLTGGCKTQATHTDLLEHASPCTRPGSLQPLSPPDATPPALRQTPHRVYPLATPPTATLSRGQLRNNPTQKIDPREIHGASAGLLVPGSALPGQRNTARGQPQGPASTTQNRTPGPWGLATGRRNAEGGVPRTESCKTKDCTSKTKPKENQSPPDTHPNKTLSTIQTIKNINFLTWL